MNNLKQFYDNKQFLLIICLVATAISMTIEVKSQNFDKKIRWEYGIKAGVNYSVLQGEDSKFPRWLRWCKDTIGELTPEWKFGPTFGAVVFYHFDKMLSLQTEVNYSAEGTKYKKDGQNPDGKITYSLEGTKNVYFVQLPILLKVAFGNRRGFNTSIKAGPILNFAYGESTDMKLSFLSNQAPRAKDTTILNTTNYLNALSFNVGIGASLDFDLWKNRMILDARYIYGIGRIEYGLSYEEDDPDLSSSLVSVTLGFVLH